MRNILIVLNTLLVFALAGVTIHALFFARQPEIQAVKPVHKKIIPTVKRTSFSYKKAEIPQTQEEVIKTITTANIFNQNRSPNSGVRARTGNATLTLVGTFKAGKYEGAIIKVKGVQNRFVSMGGFGMMPGMMPPPPMMQGQGAGGNNNSNSRRGQRSAGGMMAGDGGRRRFGPMFGMMPGNMQQSSNNNTTNGVKQYVKVGETLSTGHTLIEVTRFKAVLTRGGSKTELNLEDPSQNQIRATSTRRVNANQQFMQNSLNTQRQMMQMMQQMQNGINMSNRMMMNNMRQNSGQNNGGRGGSRR